MSEQKFSPTWLTSQKNGIAIGNLSTKTKTIDGFSALVDACPDAIRVKLPTSLPASPPTSTVLLTLCESLAQANDKIVILGISADDVVQNILQVKALLQEAPAALESFNRFFLCSLVYGKVRQICNACARSTPLSSETKSKIPEILQSSLPQTYMFGRGCAQCGHTSYYGTTELVSMVKKSALTTKALFEDTDGCSLTSIVYKEGTRSLLEDGLEKILLGQTSFEEVLRVAPGISSSFVQAINETKNSSSRKPSEPSRVMIVEDDGDQRQVLEAVFRAQGYNVSSRENGRDALAELKKNPVDLIICDLMMPVMNGADFVKELRQQPLISQIPVLMLTAVSNPDAEVAMLENGADDYCEKNVKRKVLLSRAERLIKREKKNPLGHMVAE